MVNLPTGGGTLHLSFGPPPVTCPEAKTCSTKWEAEGKLKKDTGKLRFQIEVGCCEVRNML